MATYEYHFFRPYPQAGKPDFDEQALNELAEVGWRVAHVLPSKVSTAVLLLEREVPRRAIDNVH